MLIFVNVICQSSGLLINRCIEVIRLHVTNCCIRQYFLLKLVVIIAVSFVSFWHYLYNILHGEKHSVSVCQMPSVTLINII